jgi:uncharacterized protein YjbJ (UPF0337 family)
MALATPAHISKESYHEGALQMNWDTVKGQWKQVKGKAQQKWGKLTDDDWDVIAGKRETLIGKIQERYGRDRDEAEREVDEWSRELH